MTKDFLRTPFTTLTVGLIIILAYPLLFFPKGELVLLINKYHHPAPDLFFKYFTHVGDGAVLAVLLLLLLFYSFKLSIITALSIVFQSVLVSVFKRWLFHGLPRPTAFLGDEITWHYVEGVNVHGSNTFPSGHTATAFALFALLVVVFNNRGYVFSILFFLLAFLVGLSRMYLLQHFMVDVYFGAIFGVLSVVFALMAVDRLFSMERLNVLQKKSVRSILFNK